MTANATVSHVTVTVAAAVAATVTVAVTASVNVTVVIFLRDGGTEGRTGGGGRLVLRRVLRDLERSMANWDRLGQSRVKGMP
eukprot:1223046-Amorphochlora_amoeboformis.AAC.1